MKKVAYYCFLMLFVLIVLPLLIVKSCSFRKDDIAPDKQRKTVTIRVYFPKEKVIRTMPLEEYVKGVVAAEMPAEFKAEALKAQAVAARTYAYGRITKQFVPKENIHKTADICIDSTHCQAWVSKKEAAKKWGFLSGIKYWNKISRAVNETENTIIKYNGEIINPVFHSNSGGKTENAEEVWDGNPVPYLKSVVSKGEENTKDYRDVVYIDKQEFYNKLKKEYPKLKLKIRDIPRNIKITSHSEGGRVKTIKIGNISIDGTDLRALFSLKSTNFIIAASDAHTLKITTTGYGHGVGMSQWGANAMAKGGASCEEILKWYYTGVELSSIKGIS